MKLPSMTVGWAGSRLSRQSICIEHCSRCVAGASKFYAEALKQGTFESLMNLTAGSTDSSGLDAASRIAASMGQVDEKVENMRLHLRLPFTCLVMPSLVCMRAAAAASFNMLA
jgi:hypothetical protein